MRLVDTHCHLQSEKFDEDRGEVIERAMDALEWLVVISDDLASCHKAIALTGDRIYAAVGIHPYHVESVNDALLDELRQLLAHPNVVALGEIGLDYFKYCDTPRDVQHRAFHQQLELACEVQKPVIIHNREANDDCYAILSQYADRLAGCVMHCFPGPPDFARQCLDLGFHISFAGNATFPKAQILRDTAAVVPLDRLMVETDSPYLAPQPVRGKRCEPAYVRYTAEMLADAKGVPLEDFAQETTRTAEAFFNVAPK